MMCCRPSLPADSEETVDKTWGAGRWKKWQSEVETSWGAKVGRRGPLGKGAGKTGLPPLQSSRGPLPRDPDPSPPSPAHQPASSPQGDAWLLLISMEESRVPIYIVIRRGVLTRSPVYTADRYNSAHFLVQVSCSRSPTTEMVTDS